MATKFSAALSGIKDAKAKPSPEAPAAAPVATPAKLPNTVSHRPRGRPPGKRSNPDFEPTTILLRKTTKRSAVRLMEEVNEDIIGPASEKWDFSELIDSLLLKWIEENK